MARNFILLFTVLEIECHKMLATQAGRDEVAGQPLFEDHMALIHKRQQLILRMESLEI